jgi:hypothetical protein
MRSHKGSRTSETADVAPEREEKSGFLSPVGRWSALEQLSDFDNDVQRRALEGLLILFTLYRPSADDWVMLLDSCLFAGRQPFCRSDRPSVFRSPTCRFRCLSTM